MPELPEVEVVRRGIADHVVGHTITGVAVHDVRSLRRHLAGPADFVHRLEGRTVVGAARRGRDWEVQAVPDLRAQAVEVADLVVRTLAPT